jgi:hypothetical protein
MGKIMKPAYGQPDHTSGRSRERRLHRRKRLRRIPAIISAAATPLLGVILVSQPQVPASTAQEFFDSYYSQVTQADHRKVLYREDLTRDFQDSAGSDWEDYSGWWETWEQVDVRKVESDPQNPLEFNVWLTYYSVHGYSSSEEDDFTLVCSGFWASLEARIPALGCSVNHIQIKSQMPVMEPSYHS